jgi:transcriptional regulator with XRE-family HTH domain
MDRRATDYKEWIVNRLRYLIELRGKSVAAVEKEMGWSRGFLGDALRGEKRLSLDMLLQVLDHFAKDPAEFLGGLTEEEERWARYPHAADQSQPSGIAEASETPGDDRDDTAETARLLRAMIQVLEDKGLLDRNDLQSALEQREP